ncbi:MAG: hypothetical protein ABIE47_05475 [Pseudomonadota bacterium]|uniref:Uncharacterized protein n=1 Tax=viral metagenome TaxID=1070528 RepID=A0A6M3LJ00_9ZZZZ
MTSLFFMHKGTGWETEKECAADDCKFVRPFHSKMIVCNCVWSDHYQHVLTLDHRVCDKYEHKDFHRTPPRGEGE